MGGGDCTHRRYAFLIKVSILFATVSPFDLKKYRSEADSFIAEIDLEYYVHLSGQKDQLDLEKIYGRYKSLFNNEAIDAIRVKLERGTGDQRRRLRYLLAFAVEGFIGQETKVEAAAIAQKEATLEIEVDDAKIAYRQSSVEQANEKDAERRERIERSRLATQERDLNPLYRTALERAHALATELGWKNYRAMYEDLSGIDYEALERQTHSFFEASEKHYESLLEPQLERHLGFGFDKLRRSDLPHFFRAPQHDRHFPEEKLVRSFIDTMSGLGIDVKAQKNVVLDLEERPKKSPRAFCAPVHVPDEIYLVVPRVGGRDDYFALFHEGGHTEHYAHVDRSLPFEYRRLGDNSVTEAFAFLFHHLVENPAWLKKYLGVTDVEELGSYSGASKLIYLRRYAAKLRYELTLHKGNADETEMRKLYSDYLSEATHTDWPDTTYVSDVDPGYYAASYLRAWALEATLSRTLKKRFGEMWFDRKEAGAFLKELWSFGQKLNADELLEEVAQEKLDFKVMLDEALGQD